MPHTEKLRAAASRSYPSRSGKNGWSSCHRPMAQRQPCAAASCQLLPERLRRVKVAQACRAFLAAAQRGREHAAGMHGERRGRKLCRRLASAPAPSRSGSAAPPTGRSRPMHCRAAGRRGPAALPAQRRDKPRAAASGHSRAAAAGPAPRRGARGRACAVIPAYTPRRTGPQAGSSVSSGTRCGRTASSMTATRPCCSGHAGMRAPPSGRKPRPSTAARPVNVAISLQFAAKYTGTGNRQTSPCVL